MIINIVTDRILNGAEGNVITLSFHSGGGGFLHCTWPVPSPYLPPSRPIPRSRKRTALFFNAFTFILWLNLLLAENPTNCAI